MHRCHVSLAVLSLVPLVGCPTLTPGGGSIDEGPQVQIEVRFLAVEDRFIEEIGVDFDLTLADGQATSGGPALNNPDFPEMPLAFGSDLLGGLNGARYLYPTWTTGGFLPGTAGSGGDNDPVTLAYPGALNGVVERAADTLETDFGDMPRNPADLVVGTGNSDVDAVFGRTLSDDDLADLLDLVRDDDAADVFAAPPLVLQAGQRSVVHLAAEQSLASLANLAYLTRIQALEDPPFSTWIGPAVDLAADVRDRQVSLRTTWGTRAISVPLDGLTQVDGEAVQIFVPVIETGTVRTTVTIEDGQTLLLGGVRRVGGDEVERGLPLLEDLPVLSRPFRNQSAIAEERSLLVLIRAQVISE